MKRQSIIATSSSNKSLQTVSFSLVLAPHGAIEILRGTSKDAAAGFRDKIAMSANKKHLPNLTEHYGMHVSP